MEFQEKKNETAEEAWTRILQVQKKCEFENMTPAELIAPKFLSLISRSTGDYELKMQIRKSDMTIETITDMIHEYMYDRLSESNISNDGKELQHIQHRQYKRKSPDKPSYERPWKNWTVKNQDTKTTDVASAVYETGQDHTTAQRNPQKVENVKERDITKKYTGQ